MITRNVEVNIVPTSREIADAIWNMSSVEQVDLMLALSQIYDRKTSDVLMQLSYINDVINEELTWEEKQKIIHLFESIVEYLKDGE